MHIAKRKVQEISDRTIAATIKSELSTALTFSIFCNNKRRAHYKIALPLDDTPSCLRLD